MLSGYKKVINAQGLKSLIKRPIMPPHNLAVGDSDIKRDIPLLIFTEQGTMPQKAKMPKYNKIPYEKTAIKGTNDSLSTDNFVTDDFQLGPAIEGI